MRRAATVAAATAAVVAVAVPAWAYYALRSNTVSRSFTAATLAAPVSPKATVVSATSVTVSWTLPAGQVAAAQYAVTNTTDNHAVCTAAAASCTDTAALPGVVNAYSVRTVLPGSTWASAATAFSTPAATPPVLSLARSTGAALGTLTAGTPVTLRVTAQRWSAGSLVTDTTYAGTKTLAWGGLTASPDGTAATYPATSVAFTSGASTTTLSLTAVDAGAATLTVTEGARTGSASFTVDAGTPALRFTNGTPSCDTGSVSISQTGTFVAFVSRDRDAYGNTVSTSGTPTVTVSAPGNAKGSVTSGGTLTFATNGAKETSGAATYTAAGKDTNGVTVTASAPGYVSGTCSVKQS